MRLWLISQTETTGYDVYDSAVVAAESADEAQRLHPGEYDDWDTTYASWATKPENVKVELIGEAAPEVKEGVVCASFNAG